MNEIITMPRFPLVRQALIVIAFLAFSANGFAQTTPAARELLDAMIGALGGEHFLNAKEILTGGRCFLFSGGEVSHSDLYVSYVRYPDMDRSGCGGVKI